MGQEMRNLPLGDCGSAERAAETLGTCKDVEAALYSSCYFQERRSAVVVFTVRSPACRTALPIFRVSLGTASDSLVAERLLDIK